MDIIKKITLVMVLLVSGNVFASNPADLTDIERFGPEGFAKFVYGEDSTWAFVRLPSFEKDFSLSFQAWQNEEGTTKTYTGWLTKRFSSYFDAALVGESCWKNNYSSAKTRTAFDFHGELFGRPAGIGLSLPFDSEDEVKIGPRITFGDITTFLTIGEKESCIIGASYCKKGMKIEVAYDQDEVWYIRTSKSFKTNFGKIYPELRLKVTPEEEFFGFGIGFSF